MFKKTTAQGKIAKLRKRVRGCKTLQMFLYICKMIWKQIKGFENLYEISEAGKVRSLGNGNSTNTQTKRKRIIKTGYSRNGYEKCKLHKDGKRYYFHVHRLVAFAFVENPNEKPEVNHKDGDKLNNHYLNLEWVTASENQLHAFDMGLQNARKGAESPCSKAIKQMDKNGKVLKVWGSINEACKELGLNSMGIIGCCKNKPRYKTAYGYKWQYV